MCLWWSTLICRGSSSAGTSETLLQLERAVPAAEGASGGAFASSRAAAASAAAAFGSLLIAPKAFFSSERRPPAWLGDSCFTNFPVFQAEPIPSRKVSLHLHHPPPHPPKRNPKTQQRTSQKRTPIPKNPPCFLAEDFILFFWQ